MTLPLLLAGAAAHAEAGKDISGGDIALLLIGVAAIFFLGNLALAALVFYGAHALGIRKRRKIWGTYGMSLLGTLISFGALRSGASSDGNVLVSAALWALAFAIIGYLCSPLANKQDRDVGH